MNAQNHYSEQKSTNILEKILLWAANVDMKVINECPAFDRKKYTLIGFILLLLWALSFFSTYFAVSEVKIFNENRLAKIIFAFLVSFIIFSIDRFIVSSFIEERLNHKSRFLKTLYTIFNIKFFIRLIFSLVIGIVISTPIELKIFEDKILNTIKNKINQEKSRIKTSKYEDYKNKISNEKKNLEKEIQDLIQQKINLSKELKREYVRVYDEKLQKYVYKPTKRYFILENVIKNIDNQIQRKNKEIDSTINSNLKEINTQKINDIQTINSQQIAFFEKLSTYKEITQKEPERTISLVVLLFFIMLDVTPLLLKSFSYSTYDDKIATIFELNTLAHDLKIEQQKYSNQLIVNNQNKEISIINLNNELEIKQKELENKLKYEQEKTKLDDLLHKINLQNIQLKAQLEESNKILEKIQHEKNIENLNREMELKQLKNTLELNLLKIQQEREILEKLHQHKLNELDIQHKEKIDAMLKIITQLENQTRSILSQIISDNLNINFN